MENTRSMFIKNLRYICLVGLIALGLMTIVGTGGGGGGSSNGNGTDNGDATDNSKFYGTFNYSFTNTFSCSNSGTETNSETRTAIIGSDYSRRAEDNYLYIPSNASSETYSYTEQDGDSVTTTITISGNTIRWEETVECSGIPSPCRTEDNLITYNSSYSGGTISGTWSNSNECQGTLKGSFTRVITTSPSVNTLFPSSEDIYKPATEINAIQDIDGLYIEIAGKQIIAEFSDDATAHNYDQLETFLNDQNAQIVGQIPALQMVQIETLELNGVTELVAKLRQLSYIEDAYPNQVYSLIADHTIPPNLKGGWWTEAINLSNAWDLLEKEGFSLGNIKIGIVDHGIAVNAGFFEQRVDIINPSNYMITDHGTAVAALAAGYSSKMVGVAPDSNILSYGLRKINDIAEINLGIKTCLEKGAKVVNVSTGEDRDNEPNYALTLSKHLRAQIKKSIRLAATAEYDALVVIASGNSHVEDNELFPWRVLRQTYWKKFYDSNAIIVTGAYGQEKNGKYEYTINNHYGTCIDIAAPGLNVSEACTDGKVYSYSGSSYAAPQVAGAIALLWSADHNSRPSEIKKILIDTAQYTTDKVGIGVLNLYDALIDVGLHPHEDTDVLPENGLVAYYPFNGDANDESGHGNDGSRHGATLTFDREGKNNSAFLFDGNGDKILVSDNSELKFGTGPFSISLWTRTTTNEYCVILDKDYNYLPSGMFRFDLDNSTSSVRFSLWSYINYSKYYVKIEGNTKVNNGEWHHIVGIRDIAAGKLRLYIDGKEDTIAVNDSSPGNIDNFKPMAIGGYSSESRSSFIGSIDDVRLYNRVLTTTEVQALYGK